MKTLKDLSYEEYVCDEKGKKLVGLTYISFPEELKKEAINWVKELRRMEKIYVKEEDIPERVRDFVPAGEQFKCPRCNLMLGIVNDKPYKVCYRCEIKIEWIIEFFNLNKDSM